MNDLKQFRHGEEDTHWVCEKRLKEEGSKSRCCDCEPHENPSINMPEKINTPIVEEKE